ncbi:MAG: SprB repeat-containing protein, partial [Nonlabens sp.]|uniref:SprB repeat-containing protein n=1 Tax=Nonlabens sp. TaxID=1888209 RepID=UPI0035A5A38B
MNKITFLLLTFFLFVGNAYSQTTYTNFKAGAAVIDMGITPQTDNNALKPYGLVYKLIEMGIPINWIIDPNKNFGTVSNKVDQKDFSVSGKTTRTGTISTGNKDLKAGPFLIAAEFMDTAGPIIQSWVTANPGLTVYWQLDAVTNAPVRGIITTFPNIVIYPKDGNLNSTALTDIEVGFYNRAGISGSFRVGKPENLTVCDQFYVLSHHTEPDKKWSQADVNIMHDFVLRGGNVWMGCHDVSISESLTTTGKSNSKLNFLSTIGLMPYKDDGSTAIFTPTLPVHEKGFDKDKVLYDLSSASNPIMQFIGKIHDALDGNSESVYLPLQNGAWRPSTTVGFYDPTHPDVINNKSSGKAAIIAFGPAYGNSNYGSVLYQGSHISSGTNPEWVGEARLFGNFLLQSALEKAPQITVTNLANTESVCPAEVIAASASVTGATGTITYAWASETLSGNGGALSFSSANTPRTNIAVPSIISSTTIYKVTLTVKSTPSGTCANPITAKYISTITVNPPISVAVNKVDLICNGSSDGEIKITPSGGAPTYSYAWSGPAAFASSNKDLTGLRAGTYNLTITDQNDCGKTIQVILTEPAVSTCAIRKANCPPSDLAPVCNDGTGGQKAVSWTPPSFSYQCCTRLEADKYSYVVDFNLPESSFSSSCWTFNYTQRVGGGDNLRLFQSQGNVGSKNTDSFFIGPQQYFDNRNGTDINIELKDVTNSLTWSLIVLNPTTNAVIKTYSLPNISTSGRKTLTILNTDVASGLYKLKFNFSSATVGGGDKIEVDRVYYNAYIVGTACTGGINFAVTSTHKPGDLFSTGTTPVKYTATYTPLSGSPIVDECLFDVKVIDIKVTGVIINPTCNGGTGSVNITATGGSKYTYAWTTENGSGLQPTDEDQSGLSAGTYKVIVTDADKCVSPELSVTISQPALVNPPTADVTNPTCAVATGTIT